MGSRTGVWRALRLMALMTLLVITTPAFAWDDARVQAGLDFFPSFLAADTRLKDKTDADNHLTLAILHQGNLEQAQQLAQRLKKVGTIRRLPLRIVLTDDPRLTQFQDRPPAGVFIAAPRPDDLDVALRWGRRAQRIVFSPFLGDVERGALGGVAVRETVLPLVNQQALDDWDIVLKPFFLRIAERYDER